MPLPASNWWNVTILSAVFVVQGAKTEYYFINYKKPI